MDDCEKTVAMKSPSPPRARCRSREVRNHRAASKPARATRKSMLVLSLETGAPDHDLIVSLVAREVRRLLFGIADTEIRSVECSDRRLLDILSGYGRAFLIDVIKKPAEGPGALYRLLPEQLPIDEGLRAMESIHLAPLVDFGRLAGFSVPEEIVIFAVEVPAQVGCGGNHHPVFLATLEFAGAQIASEVLDHLQAGLG